MLLQSQLKFQLRSRNTTGNLPVRETLGSAAEFVVGRIRHVQMLLQSQTGRSNSVFRSERHALQPDLPALCHAVNERKGV